MPAKDGEVGTSNKPFDRGAGGGGGGGEGSGDGIKGNGGAGGSGGVGAASFSKLGDVWGEVEAGESIFTGDVDPGESSFIGEVVFGGEDMEVLAPGTTLGAK